MSDNTGNARHQLRRSLRTRRQGLSPRYRQLAGREVARRLTSTPEYRRARVIAVYLAFDGELPLDDVIRAAKRHGKQLVAPRLNRRRRLEFLPLAGRPRLQPNQLGIHEPVGTQAISLRRIDIVLTPLVAFDRRGTRLGMGGGHYDRCFGFLLQRRWLRPKLIGVGYHFQAIETLARKAWDVPLQGAVTDNQTYRFKPYGNMQ